MRYRISCDTTDELYKVIDALGADGFPDMHYGICARPDADYRVMLLVDDKNKSVNVWYSSKRDGVQEISGYRFAAIKGSTTSEDN